jgi:hypothetical protein
MATPPITLAVSPALPGEQFAMAAAYIFKFADDLTLMLNTPEMLAARQRQDVQKILDGWNKDLASAQAGSADALARVNEESSG